MNVSSQDFRNIYEKFYARMRNYLWSYDVLKVLSDVEFGIYSAFINETRLKADLTKLQSAIKEVIKEDTELGKHIVDMLNILSNNEINMYSRLPQVSEVNPENNKAIRTIPEKGE